MGKIITILLTVLILFSCKTKTVVVPEIHTEYKTKIDTFMQQDSIHIKDSIFVMQRGDTIFVDHWRTKYSEKTKYKSLTDTLIVTDTISIPVYIEKSGSGVSKWYVWMLTGGLLTAGGIAFIMYKFK